MVHVIDQVLMMEFLEALHSANLRKWKEAASPLFVPFYDGFQ